MEQREKTNKLLGGIKQSEYEKILKHTVTEFFDEFGSEKPKSPKIKIAPPKRKSAIDPARWIVPIIF